MEKAHILNKFARKWNSRCESKNFPIANLSVALLLVVAIFSSTPQGVAWFESSMTMHMLVQIPLLILLGAACYQPTAKYNDLLIKFDPLGALAFICFTGWMWFWMLPLNLDFATIHPSTRLLKIVSAPIAIGFCFQWLWSRANDVFKCMIVFEVWASITRLGWLYLESPLQLCSSYLIGEQQQVGTLLLQASAISAIIVIFYSLFGSFDKNIDCELAKLPHNDQ